MIAVAAANQTKTLSPIIILPRIIIILFSFLCQPRERELSKEYHSVYAILKNETTYGG